MRKIKYKKLSVQNFLSVGNDTIDIEFKDGLNLITGKNLDNPERKNAVGKSVVIDAFYYALFGKTIREIKKEFVLHNQSKSKGNIELTFDVDKGNEVKSYKVIRSIKPSSVALWCGDEDITRDSIDNTNKFICDLVGSNPVLCKSCDILSLSDNIPFMSKTAAEKRKFIEDIFSLVIFGGMMKDLKDILKENKNDMGISSARLEEINSNLDILVKQFEENRKKIEEREAILEEKKTKLILEIKNDEESINSFVAFDYDNYNTKVSEYNSALEKVKEKIQLLKAEDYALLSTKKQLNSQIDKISSITFAECDKCLQSIDHNHIEIINQQKEDIVKSLSDTTSQQNDLQIKITDLKNKEIKLVDVLNVYHNKKYAADIKLSEHKSRQANVNSLKDQLDILNTSQKDSLDVLGGFEENIQTSKHRKDEQVKIYSGLKQNSEDLEVVKFILGEEGVKSVIVKKLLGMLNSSIQKYITSLGLSIRCKFDEYFDEEISNGKGNKFSYFNLSGGERRTLDLACAWSFKDIKRKISGVSSNVEFCDEIFDSAFDERGFDLLIEVIKERISNQNMSIYAISHRKEAHKHMDGEEVYLEKENYVTRRVVIDD